jgi:hypothetical protein
MNIRVLSSESFSDLGSSPVGELLLKPHNQLLNLHRKLVGVPIGSPTAVRQALNSAILVAVVDLIAGFPRDSELMTEACHLLSIQEPSNESKSFFHDIALLPRHNTFSLLREKVLPMSPE